MSKVGLLNTGVVTISGKRLTGGVGDKWQSSFMACSHYSGFSLNETIKAKIKSHRLYLLCSI